MTPWRPWVAFASTFLTLSSIKPGGNSMRRSNFLIAFYLLLIFASGVVVGAFATRLYAAKTVIAKAPRMTPEEFRRAYTTEMQSRLNLTSDQMTKLNVILDQTGSKAHDERERHNQAIKVIHEEQVGKIRAILAEPQLPEYEKLRNEREERARKARAEK